MSPTSAPAAVIYGRQSHARRKSIDEQLQLNHATAAEHGWTVVAELSDASSASRYATRARENWARLLELLPRIDVVVLWEPSRGDRTLLSWVAFLDACREHRVRIHAVTHHRTYDPRVPRDYRSLAEDGVDSAYESDKTSDRSGRGVAGAAMAGLPHSGVTYGYLRRYDPVTRRFAGQEPHPEHAGVVRDIIRSVGRGEPIHAITRRLNDGRISPPRGGEQWGAPSVRLIAMNPAYRPHPDDPARGTRVHRTEQYPAQWPPLVTAAEWRAAQVVLGANSEARRRARRDTPPGRVRYLLSGNRAVMASACGRGLVPSAGRHYQCEGDSCAAGPIAEVDEYVTRLVVARLARKDARRLWVVDDDAARQAAEAELRQLHDELQAAQKSFAAPGGISAAAMAAKEAAMAPAIADAQRRAQPAGVPLAALELIEAAKFGQERVRGVWDGLPVQARREVIAGLFDRLTLGPATVRITRWTSPAERLEIVGGRIAYDWRKP